jgi:ribosomal-protein-alanine N-acetyltransferase
MRIATARLDLVPAPREFLDAVVAGRLGDAEAVVGVRLPGGWPLDPELRAGLVIHLEHLRHDPSEWPWRLRLIVVRATGAVAGTINLKGRPGPDGGVDVGWGLDPPYRGQGLATEGAAAVIRWALAQPGVRRVTARIQPENVASVRVAERLGFRPTDGWYPGEGRIWELIGPPAAPAG